MTQSKKRGTDDRFCTFCSKSRSEVRNLIAGPGEICICDECVEICNQILKVEKKPGKTLKTAHRPYPLKRLPTPVEKVQRDSDRDYFMSAEEAKKYGLVDEVVESLKDTESKGGGDMAAREDR